MAVDMFIELGATIKGETQDKDFKAKNACDVLAWSWGLSQSGSFHAGGGGGSGKANFQDLSFTKWIDKATPALMIAVAKGAHIAECKLTCRKAGEGAQKYIEITMKKCLVSSLSTGGSGGEDKLTENVSLNFAEVSFEYYMQDAKGGTASAGKLAWNIEENAAAG